MLPSALSAFESQVVSDACQYIHSLGFGFNCSHVYVQSVQAGSAVIQLYLLYGINQTDIATSLINNLAPSTTTTTTNNNNNKQQQHQHQQQRGR